MLLTIGSKDNISDLNRTSTLYIIYDEVYSAGKNTMLEKASHQHFSMLR